MLEEQVRAFIQYCKVSGFKGKSIESLTVRLNEFNKFLQSILITSITGISYRHLLKFVADYRSPSVHIKKARIWALIKELVSLC